ncbi:MAG: DNA-binding protein [bacterium]|nr:DNA-binding protein [bacterium]
MLRFIAAMMTLSASSILVTACNAQSTEQPSTTVTEVAAHSAFEPSESGARSGVVVETIDAASYTYVQVDTGTEVFWAAAPRCEVTEGQEITVPAGIPMENFHSDTLDRDFPLIFFVSEIGEAGHSPAMGHLPTSHATTDIGSTRSAADLPDIAVPKDGISIGTLYATKNELIGKEVTIRAKVAKVNLGIMGRNWIHIRDGSGDEAEGTHDLTITTNDVATVGDTVVISGAVTLDKDFGAGYFYQLIIEEAAVTIE